MIFNERIQLAMTVFSGALKNKKKKETLFN